MAPASFDQGRAYTQASLKGYQEGELGHHYMCSRLPQPGSQMSNKVHSSSCIRCECPYGLKNVDVELNISVPFGYVMMTRLRWRRA